MSRTTDLISKHPFELEFLRRLTDVVVLAAAAYVASYLCFNAPLYTTAPIHTLLLYFCIALAFFAFPKSGMYGSWRGRFMPSILGRLISAWALVLLVGLFYSFLIHRVAELSRLWLFYWYFIGITFLALYRVVAYFALLFLRHKGFNNKRVVIVGYGHTGQEMHKRALQQDWYGYDVIAVHADDKDALYLPPPVLGNSKRWRRYLLMWRQTRSMKSGSPYLSVLRPSCMICNAYYATLWWIFAGCPIS